MINIDKTKYYIQKFKKRHEDKYDYSLIKEITSNKQRVSIICPLHGIFESSVANHGWQTGCSKCGREQANNKTRLSKEEFVAKAHLKHNDKFLYTSSEYTNFISGIKIFCKKHGEFITTPSNHLYQKNGGCPECNERKRITTSEFIRRSIERHGNKYDYSESNYINSSSKIKIICPQHGEFYQKPHDHFGQGNGCPKCKYLRLKSENFWLDSFKIPHLQKQFKIEIKDKKYIVDGFDAETNTIYEFLGDFWHGNPKIYDPNKINPANKKTFGELHFKTQERHRVLKNNGFNLIFIWSSDLEKDKDFISYCKEFDKSYSNQKRAEKRRKTKVEISEIITASNKRRIWTEKSKQKLIESRLQKLRQKYLGKYRFLSPDGKNIEIEDLVEFCTQNKLKVSILHNVWLGNQKSHKGWSKSS